MQEFQIVRWCDWHLKRDGEKVPAKRSTPLAVDNENAEVDLCPSCEEQIAGPIRELLKAIGSRVERPEPKEESEDGTRAPVLSQCPLCPRWMDVRSRTGHVKGKHPGMSPGEIDWRYSEDFDQVWACGCGLTFPAARGRDMHVRRGDKPECLIPEGDTPLPAKRPV